MFGFLGEMLNLSYQNVLWTLIVTKITPLLTVKNQFYETRLRPVRPETGYMTGPSTLTDRIRTQLGTDRVTLPVSGKPVTRTGRSYIF